MATVYSAHQPTSLREVSEPTLDGVGYRWILTPTERSHIAAMLNCDTSDIALNGNIMAQDRQVCKGCGKFSGLDDLVHNAKHLAVHSPTFMLDILKNGPKNGSPPHALSCSSCGVMYDGEFSWPFPENWAD
ncbi:RBP protein [Aspergillus novofumigatus IBT 16806]|uniref:RBP protein n=1 Tax=Aspergillus novofumigatus (strain IBT 16806) TaxID=1392255 RepID=A0A2I1CF74_ASPN1|nr:RBP protein [Aspergillus novofumigatus IBT 16806]PKX96287.1 RBP protein [Aspergillus novofumigatus IBT 16806]